MTTKYIIRVWPTADITLLLSNLDTSDGYLKAYDADRAFPGKRADQYPTGFAEMTWNKNEAMTFDSFEACVELWKSISKTCPLRPDGKPNRPLSAYTISPEKFEPLN